ncbi:MAG: NAD(+)/NADH kinase, partial [Clostridia bacterium]|nr:NAD(+)/NADH kinase [Clostridia bacterium]
MSKELKKAVISFSRKKNIGNEALSDLVSILQSCGCEMASNEELMPYFPEESRRVIRFLPLAEAYDWADFAIILGGDGSILSASYYASQRDVPILGINFGKIGYMASLDADRMNTIPSIVAGGYTLDSRMMLDAELISQDGTVRAKRTFLNDCA